MKNTAKAGIVLETSLEELKECWTVKPNDAFQCQKGVALLNLVIVTYAVLSFCCEAALTFHYFVCSEIFPIQSF